MRASVALRRGGAARRRSRVHAAAAATHRRAVRVEGRPGRAAAAVAGGSRSRARARPLADARGDRARPAHAAGAAAVGRRGSAGRRRLRPAVLDSYLGVLASQTARLTALVDDIVELSRITSGLLEAVPAAIAVEDLVSNALADGHDHAERRGVSLTARRRRLDRPSGSADGHPRPGGQPRRQRHRGDASPGPRSASPRLHGTTAWSSRCRTPAATSDGTISRGCSGLSRRTPVATPTAVVFGLGLTTAHRLAAATRQSSASATSTAGVASRCDSLRDHEVDRGARRWDRLDGLITGSLRTVLRWAT